MCCKHDGTNLLTSDVKTNFKCQNRMFVTWRKWGFNLFVLDFTHSVVWTCPSLTFFHQPIEPGIRKRSFTFSIFMAQSTDERNWDSDKSKFDRLSFRRRLSLSANQPKSPRTLQIFCLALINLVHATNFILAPCWTYNGQRLAPTQVKCYTYSKIIGSVEINQTNLRYKIYAKRNSWYA